MDGLSRDTAIVAKALEEVMAMAMIIATCRVGSVLILNANFMPRICGEGGNCIKNCKECAGEGVLEREEERRDNAAGEVTATASQWFLGAGKNLVVRKLSLRSRTTDRPDRVSTSCATLSATLLSKKNQMSS
jgi:hypothetical protein